jgi:O-antigen/teichoic acid export membrane protein
LLSGGTFLGQATLIVISPVLTRMFTPAEFGVLAVFTALTSMMIVAMALRYEFAIPVCRDDDDALAMLVLCAVVTTGITLLLTVLILGYGQQIAAIFGLHGHEDLLWLAPPSLWLWGLSLPLANWTIRRSAFRLNAGSNLAQFATQAMAQLSLGALGGGGSALVIGYSLGPVARLALLRNALGARDRARLTKLTPSRVWRMAREHWRYPVFSSSSSVLQSASQMLPAVLVAALYGPAAAGLFGLTQRILGAPVRMLSEAASQVFLGEIARAEGPKLLRLFRRTVLVFFTAGAAGAAPLVLAGPALFALVFGESWREAGQLVQLLVPLYLTRFVVVPVSQTLNVTGKQHYHLAASLLNALALAASFGLGAALDLPMNTTVLLYGLGSTASFLLYLAMAWRSARAASRTPDPSASSGDIRSRLNREPDEAAKP